MQVKLVNGHPQVESQAGNFKGRIIKSRNGRDIYTFEGIPYAKPPMGELRFKDPVKMPKLEGMYEATNGSIKCYQPPFTCSIVSNTSDYQGTEDCLYLNVYVPKYEEKKDLLPVLVWIHGGGYYLGSGSTNLNGPDYLLDKNMILVSVNYRLGILGFLSTGDRVIPGNFGMKDQIMALKWIQENITAFGGDPSSVTIAGESSGGASVSLLMHSPLSKGLFKNVIAQSGTCYSLYTIKTWSEARKQAEHISKVLGCSFESNDFLTHLQKLSLEDLFQASIDIKPKALGAVVDVPVFEDPHAEAFITKDSWMKPTEYPIIAGATNREAMFFLKELSADPKFRDGGISSLRKDLNTLMPIWGCYANSTSKDRITDELAKFYFGKGGIEDANEEQITNLMSDLRVNYGLYLTGKREKGPSYIYILSYKGYKNIPFEPPKGLEDGVSHGEDLIYLFKTDWFPKSEWNKEDLDMSNQIVDMWFNFMKYSNPTPESGIWLESEKGDKYLDITNQGLIMKSKVFQERMEFLEQLNIDKIRLE